MKSELCKKCIHTDVCFKDKNVCGDVFVPGNPMLFDNNELYRKYKEREKAGFPCEYFFPVVVLCKECKHRYVDDTNRYVDGVHVRYNLCELNHNSVQSDEWFCADGEKVTEC